MANQEAERLFGAGVQAGAEVAGAGLPRRLVELISDVSGRPVASRTTSTPLLVLAGERVLVCTVGGVTRDGHDLGVVVSARDRTDIEALTRQLDAVQTMGTALRAQRHEFANRLHVVHGLLSQGDLDEATDYVRSVLGAGPLGSLLDGLDAVPGPDRPGIPVGQGRPRQGTFGDPAVGTGYLARPHRRRSGGGDDGAGQPARQRRRRSGERR